MVQEALIERANKGVYGNDNDGRWKYDWYRPIKPVENSHGSEISDPLAGISSENKETSYYSFRFKTWMKSMSVEKPIDPPVLLNLADFDRVKIAQEKRNTGKKTNGDDLSEDAIRGAVGGSDSVFTSSHAKPETAVNKKDQTSSTAKVEDDDKAVVPDIKSDAGNEIDETNLANKQEESSTAKTEELKDTQTEDINVPLVEEQESVSTNDKEDTGIQDKKEYSMKSGNSEVNDSVRSEAATEEEPVRITQSEVVDGSQNGADIEMEDA